MNVNMYENPIVQENIRRLKALGYYFIEPGSGMLACGYEGKGRMAEPPENRELCFEASFRGYGNNGTKSGKF